MILLFVGHHGTVQAERAVAFHARFVSESILRERLVEDDFAKPVRVSGAPISTVSSRATC